MRKQILRFFSFALSTLPFSQQVMARLEVSESPDDTGNSIERLKGSKPRSLLTESGTNEVSQRIYEMQYELDQQMMQEGVFVLDKNGKAKLITTKSELKKILKEHQQRKLEYDEARHSAPSTS